MIDTVIFDIGNVLGAFDWVKFLNGFGFSSEVNEEIARAVFMSEDWHQVDIGLKTDEELIEGFIKNAPRREKEIRKVFEKWQYLVTEYDFSADWVKDLKAKGYRVYVLSNYGSTLFAYAKEHFEFLKHIDGGIISYQINKIKPDPMIYKALIEKYSIVPENAVFLDDLEENLKGARGYGIHTVHVTSHIAAINGLKSLGIE